MSKKNVVKNLKNLVKKLLSDVKKHASSSIAVMKIATSRRKKSILKIDSVKVMLLMKNEMKLLIA